MAHNNEQPSQPERPVEDVRVRCEECGAMFPNGEELTAHVRRSHVRGNLG